MGSNENGDSPAAAGREGGVILGVDGGTTSTVCVCLPAAMPPPEAPGAVPVLSRAVAGCSNRNSVGENAALETLEQVMTQALTMAISDRSAVRAVCLSVSGVNHPSDQQKMLDWIRNIFPGHAKFYVENDAVAALASGTMGKLHGCVLIAGTGSIAYGVTEDGKVARAAGAGPVLGDWGRNNESVFTVEINGHKLSITVWTSGYGIAAQALTAVIKAHDGRGPETNLTREILRKLDISSPDELIGWTYADPSWARIAALVPVVLASAEDGDEVANKILHDAVQELAGSVVAVVRRLKLCGEDGKDQFPLVLVGGVLEGNKKWNISGEVIKCICQVFPGVHPIRPEVEPAIGAALLAWSHLRKGSNLETRS